MGFQGYVVRNGSGNGARGRGRGRGGNHSNLRNRDQLCKWCSTWHVKECKKLQKEVEKLRPDAERIERQLHERRAQNLRPLEAQNVWLAKVYAKMDDASREVHECSSGTRFSRFILPGSVSLAKRIVELTTDVKDLAEDPAIRTHTSTSIDAFDTVMHSGLFTKACRHPPQAVSTLFSIHIACRVHRHLSQCFLSSILFSIHIACQVRS